MTPTHTLISKLRAASVPATIAPLIRQAADTLEAGLGHDAGRFNALTPAQFAAVQALVKYGSPKSAAYVLKLSTLTIYDQLGAAKQRLNVRSALQLAVMYARAFPND